jgi:hypothetical protein
MLIVHQFGRLVHYSVALLFNAQLINDELVNRMITDQRIKESSD